jgi:hypothetical protein
MIAGMKCVSYYLFGWLVGCGRWLVEVQSASRKLGLWDLDEGIARCV